MEGDGRQAVVAIIQGLQDAGLSVALMSSPPLHNSLRSRRKMPTRKFSVETSTDCPKRTASAQICDAHYASSYQLAHCRLKPTTPSHYLTEFPEQRRAPSRTRGNFRLFGSYGCREATSAEFKCQRNQGSFHQSPSRLLPCDSFVESLRKYPLPAGRSASSEIIQRLLSYTQAKHLSQNNSLSMRSLASPRPSRVSKHKKANKQANKQAYKQANKQAEKQADKQASKISQEAQTYTRTMYEPQIKQSSKRKSRRNSKVDTRPNMDQISETYNYLKASRSGRRSYTGQNSEVRYLNDVKRYIKETIKQLLNQAPVNCPKVENRYIEHRRLHHKQTDSNTSSPKREIEVNTEPIEEAVNKRNSRCTGTSPHSCQKILNRLRSHRQLCRAMETDDNELNEAKEDKASLSLREKKSCCLGTTASIGICPKALRRYRSHRKLHHGEDIDETELNATEANSPVYCRPPPGTKRSFSLSHPFIWSHKDQATSGSEVDAIGTHKRDAKYSSDAEGLIYDDEESVSDDDVAAHVIEWLTQLPAFVKNTPENQDILLDMVQDLIAEIKDLVGHYDYHDRAMEKIIDFLEKIPMTPHEDGLEDQYEDLAEVEYTEIRKILDKWLSCIDLLLDTKTKNDKSSLLDKFVKALEPIVKTAGTKTELKTAIMKLDLKPDEDQLHGHVDLMSRHIENLVDKLYHFIELKEKRTRHRIKIKKAEQMFLNWLENLEDIPEKIKEQNRSLAVGADRKLNQLISENAEDDDMALEINAFFDSLPNEDIPLTSEEKNELTNNFLSDTKHQKRVLKSMNLREKYEQAKALLNNLKHKLKNETINASDRPLIDWLENVPNVPKEIKTKNKDTFRNFHKKLQQLKSSNVDDDVVEGEINEFIDTFPKRGIFISSNQKSELARNIQNNMRSKPISNELASDWLRNASNISETIKNKYLNLFKDFDKQLQQFNSDNADDEVIEGEINDFLDSLPEKGIMLTPSQESRFAKTIMKQTTSVSNKQVTDWLKNMPNVSEELKKRSIHFVQNFNEKLQQMISEKASEDYIDEEIKNLFNLLSKEGISFTPSQQSQLVKKLLYHAESKSNKLNNQVAAEWLENAPNVSEEVKMKNKNFVASFDNKLKKLKSQGADNGIIQDEVNTFLDSLSQKGISITPSQKIKLAQNLANQTKPKSGIVSNRPAADWFENSANIPEKVRKKNNNLFKNVDKKLQQPKSQNAEDKVIDEEVNDFLDSLPQKGTNKSPQTIKLARNLVNQSTSESDSINNRPATEWLENAPNIPEEVKKKNKDLIKNFDKKLQQLKSQNADDEVIEEEIHMFLDSLPKKNIYITSSQGSHLAKNLVNQTKSEPVSISNRPAAEWFKNVPNIPEEAKRKNKNVIKKFDKKLQKLKYQNADDDIIEELINDFLDSLPEKGISITPSQKIQLAKNLMNQTKSKADSASNQPVAEWFENAPNIPEKVKRKNRDLIKKFDKTLHHLKSQGANDDFIQEKVSEFVDSLPQEGIYISPSQKTELAQSLSNQRKLKPGGVSNRPVTEWLESTSNIPEKVKRKNRDVFKKFDKKLQQLRSQNADDDVIDEEINEFLKSLSDKGISITPLQKSQLAEKLAKPDRRQFATVRIEPVTVKHADSHDIEEIIKKLLGSLTPNVPEEVKNKISVDLAKKLQQLKSKNADDGVIGSEINKFVDSLAKNGLPLSPIQKSKLIEILSKHFVSHPSKTNKQPVTDWLENAPYISGQTKKVTRNLAKNVDKRLQQLNSDDVNIDVIEAEISPLLDSLFDKEINVSATEKAQLTKNILNEIRPTDNENTSTVSVKSGPPVMNWLENAENIPENIKRKNRNKIRDFDEKLKDLQSKHVDNAIIEKVIKQFAESLSENGIPMSSKQKNQLISDLLSNIKSDPKQRKRWDQIEEPKVILAQKLKRQSSTDFQISTPIKDKGRFIDKTEPYISNVSSITDDIDSGDVPSRRPKPRLTSHSEDIKEKNNISKRPRSQKCDDVSREPQRTQKSVGKTGLRELGDKISQYRDELVCDAFITDKFIEENITRALLDWLKEQYIYQDRSSNEKRVQENLIRNLGDKLIALIGQTLTPDVDIDSILLKEIKKHLHPFPMDPELKLNEAFMEGLATDILHYLKDLQFLNNISQNLGPSSIDDRIDKWVSNLPFSRMDSIEKTNLKNLTDNFKKNIKEIGLHDDRSLRNETKTFLENVSLELNNAKDQTEVLNALEDKLVEILKGTSLKVRGPASDKIVKEAVEKWIETLDLPEFDNDTLKNIISEAKAELVSTLINDVIANEVSTNEIDKIFQDAIHSFLEKIPHPSYQDNDIQILANSLEDAINNCSKKYSELSHRSDTRKAADILLDGINNWVKNLPIESDTPEGKVDAENFKQQIETKIIHKIGEINMNPVLLNDDFLYLDMLGDEVDDLLANTQSEKVKNVQPRLKKDLLNIVKKARQKTREENAGQFYKQQLREEIARTLPPFELSEEGQALFEVLKDHVADAFINMHYVRNDEKEINKLKKIIDNELYDFCDVYLKKCPALPLDTMELTKNVYNALENIIEPQNESFRNEVEFVKIKGEVDNWVKELPLNMQTENEKFRINKIISVLAKKLYDIENMRILIPDRELEEKMKKETTQFLKKLPLPPDGDVEMNQLAEILLKNLKDTEESRRLNALTRHSIQLTDSCFCCVPSTAPCTLSKEDQDHLERIRKRTPPLRRRTSFKDISSSPRPIDAGSQTEINSSSFCRICNPCLSQRNSSAQTSRRQMQGIGSQIDVPPDVNEHSWDFISEESCVQAHGICPYEPCPSYGITPRPRRPISPSRRPCSPSAPKYTYRPNVTHPSQIQGNPGSQTRPSLSQHQIRVASRSEYQVDRPAARPEQLQIHPGIHRTAPGVSTLPHQDQNMPQRGSHSYPYQLPRSASPNIPCQYEPFSRRPEQTPQRVKVGHQSSPYSPSRQYPAHELQGLKNTREVSSTPSSPRPGPTSQSVHRSPRPHQDNQPKTCVASNSPPPCQGQSFLTTESSSLSQQSSSRTPHPTPEPISSDYEPGPSCSFQKRVTRVGSLDHASQPCFGLNWDNCMHSEEEWGERKRCRCKPKCGKFNGRRKPCHLYNDESMNSCSKCCGVHCPFPSCLFFR